MISPIPSTVRLASPAAVPTLFAASLDRGKAWWLRRRVAGRLARFPFLRRVSLRLGATPDPVFCRVEGSDLLVLSGIFEEGEYSVISKWNLPTDATVLDLGGNVGFATLYFSTLIPKMRGLVVEPDANNYDLLELNCRRLITDGQVRGVQAFIAAREGIAGIDRSGRSWSFKKLGQPKTTGSLIACVTIPTLIRDAGFDEIDLLKCDVEGTEAELFADCAGWVHRVKHMIVETHEPYWPHDLYRDLKRAGWEFEITSEKHCPTISIVGLRRKDVA